MIESTKTINKPNASIAHFLNYIFSLPLQTKSINQLTEVEIRTTNDSHKAPITCLFQIV